MSSSSYVSAADLCDAIGAPTFMAIFDDNNTGDRATVDASTAVKLCISRAHAQVKSWMPSINAQMPAETPAVVDELLRDAELQAATIYAYRRHPEYCKTYGAEPSGKMWAEFIAMMKRIQSAQQQLDATASPAPPPPSNMSSVVFNASPCITVTSDLDDPAGEILGDF